MIRFSAAVAMALLASSPAWAASPTVRIEGKPYSAAHLTFKRAYHCPIDRLRIIDGDTLVCKGKHVRILGLDTPELHIPCEHDRAVAAKNRLSELLVAPHRVLIREARTLDRYGRALAVVLTDNHDVAPILIGEGLAHPYSGGTRGGWC
ncbi:MAG: thermonuclease family protein [Armatimonadetes bacterium]|nr:thermonuclease family protein [Armatimonadota bacterium]